MPEQTVNTPRAGQEPAQGPPEGTDPPESAPDAQDGSTGPDDDPETFPRAYVENLRREAAQHRTRAARVDDLAYRLHTALVAATGRLADPDDLPFQMEHLDDETALAAAVDDLLSRKPHLASRRPTGDVGQGATGTSADVDLAGLLRGLAG